MRLGMYFGWWRGEAVGVGVEFNGGLIGRNREWETEGQSGNE